MYSGIGGSRWPVSSGRSISSVVSLGLTLLERRKKVRFPRNSADDRTCQHTLCDRRSDSTPGANFHPVGAETKKLIALLASGKSPLRRTRDKRRGQTRAIPSPRWIAFHRLLFPKCLALDLDKSEQFLTCELRRRFPIRAKAARFSVQNNMPPFAVAPQMGQNWQDYRRCRKGFQF